MLKNLSSVSAVMLAVAIAAVPSQANDRSAGSWDKRIDNAQARFKVLQSFDGEAVLDRETNLVWARTAGDAHEPDQTYGWTTALIECYVRDIGGRRGWRLPLIEELASLVDPSQDAPALPDGHPFLNVHSGFYWSATTVVDQPTNAWSVDMGSGTLSNVEGKQSSSLFTWCVRSGAGIDGM